MAAKGWRRSGGKMVRSGVGVAPRPNLNSSDPSEIRAALDEIYGTGEVASSGGMKPVDDALKDRMVRARLENSDEDLVYALEHYELSRHMELSPLERIERLARIESGEVPIYGNFDVSQRERRSANLPDDESQWKNSDRRRLNNLRNGYRSQEEFFNSDPELTQEGYSNNPRHEYVTLYSGKRVMMSLGADGDVGFTVDGTYYADPQSPSIPSSELRNMARTWRDYTKSPAGKRVFSNTPMTGDGKGQSRYEAYKRWGFKLEGGDVTNIRDVDDPFMIFDNR